MDIPKDHETYLHRIGRAGRFGEIFFFKFPNIIVRHVESKQYEQYLAVCSIGQYEQGEQHGRTKAVIQPSHKLSHGLRKQHKESGFLHNIMDRVRFVNQQKLL